MEEEDDLDLGLEDELEKALEMDEDLEEADAQPQAPEGDIPASQGAEGDKAAEEAGTSEAEEGEPDELSDPRKDAEAQQTKRNAEYLAMMTEDQIDRYEAFRRSSLQKASMRKLLHSATGQPPQERLLVAICGITKLFVGELVETAREIAAAEGDVGPLQPHHVHAAYQRLDKQGVIPGQKRKRRALSH
ncbi:g7921 [Coccomyxa viridis]|uniref:G7921 protein n=1 Tax=Coccomyxa viridis TaxID=1274662 RepID=A0ABP1G1J9_9CHLO